MNPAEEIAQLRAEAKLLREWLERAERDLASAHEEIGRLREQIERLTSAARTISNG